MIPFNKPPYTGNEDQHVLQAIKSEKLAGGGPYTKKSHEWFEKNLGCKKALLTPSCTHALEMAALLIDVKPGDEVIMPSYTFVSTANAFALRGAKIKFVDIRPDTMNIDERKIEAAITGKTKAIVPVHYAGVSCEMNEIMRIAEKHGFFVIEDAARGMMSTYKSAPLGTLGHMGAYSFHETKNYTSGGEGGLLIINDTSLIDRAEVIREKGTDRSKFFRGMVDKYSWVDIGSSYLPSDMQAAYLYGQLERSSQINNERLETWNYYFESFAALETEGLVERPKIPDACVHNAHMFYLKCEGLQDRTTIIENLKRRGVSSVFHYVPLHSAQAGEQHGVFHDEDRYTTVESEKLFRLPIWFGMTRQNREHVVSSTIDVIRSLKRTKK